MAGQALGGLRVLDLSSYIAGPYCTKLLADYGADVVKIEPPATGDAARQAGPFLDDNPDPETSGLFLHLNTNKKSITLDIATQTGSQILRRLVATADILVESFPPGYLSPLGLDFESLQEINPGLVMVSITPFGQHGPYKDFKDADIVLEALGGMLICNGEPDRMPLKMAGAQAYYQAGIHSAVATMTAIFHRDQTGEGQHVDVAVVECVAAILVPRYTSWSYKGDVNHRRGNGRGNWAVYPCDNGFVSINVYFHGREWAAVPALMKIPALADPKFTTAAGRREYVDELEELLLSWFIERDKKEIYYAGQGNRVAIGYACTTEDLLNSPQLAAREYFQMADHQKAGRLSYPGAPFKLSETPWQLRHSAPLLGENNEEVLCGELGLSKEDLVKLRERGII